MINALVEICKSTCLVKYVWNEISLCNIENLCFLYHDKLYALFDLFALIETTLFISYF